MTLCRTTRRSQKRSWETGDWTIFPDVYTEDGVYIEHSFGEFRGRKAIADFLVRCQALPARHGVPARLEGVQLRGGLAGHGGRNRLVIPEKPGVHFDLIN